MFYVKVDRERCGNALDCMICVHKCPRQSLMAKIEGLRLSKTEKVKYRYVFQLFPSRCDGCGDCVKLCPNNAIQLVP